MLHRGVVAEFQLMDALLGSLTAVSVGLVAEAEGGAVWHLERVAVSSSEGASWLLLCNDWLRASAGGPSQRTLVPSRFDALHCVHHLCLCDEFPTWLCTILQIVCDEHQCIAEKKA